MLKLNHIHLFQFKNCREATFNFSKHIIGIAGANGVGKTNLLDAIYYLCFTKGYFSGSDANNVLRGKAGWRIAGEMDRDDTLENAQCLFRETGKKEFSVNKLQYSKFSEHIGRYTCVVIAPDDTAIIIGSSSERRKFIDIIICQLDAVYLQHLMRYNKLLALRNAALKNLQQNANSFAHLLHTYNEQMAPLASYIYTARKEFVLHFFPKVIALYTQISGEEENIQLFYRTHLETHSWEQLVQMNRQKDMASARSNGGIHKDDIEICMNEIEFKNSASQGQRKTMLFALKLAEIYILKEAKGYAPLLLLDDVFEKLDENRIANLLKIVGTSFDSQVFITDTHKDRLENQLKKLAIDFQLIELTNNSIP